MTASPPDPRDPREHRSRRTFSELQATKGLRDVDATQTGVRMYQVVVGAVTFFMGSALSVFLVVKGMAPLWVAVLCPFLFAAAGASSVRWMVGGAGVAASRLYAPSGKTTPPKRQYSQAEAMVAQGRYEDGITTFELAVSEYPTDPTPYLRIARVYRDHLSRHDDSARWFRRALRESAMPQGMAFLAMKELVELYTHRLGQPERALPELARMAETWSGTDEGAWAAAELAEIKSRMSNPDPGEEEEPETTT